MLGVHNYGSCRKILFQEHDYHIISISSKLFCSYETKCYFFFVNIQILSIYSNNHEEHSLFFAVIFHIVNSVTYNVGVIIL